MEECPLFGLKLKQILFTIYYIEKFNSVITVLKNVTCRCCPKNTRKHTSSIW